MSMLKHVEDPFANEPTVEYLERNRNEGCHYAKSAAKPATAQDKLIVIPRRCIYQLYEVGQLPHPCLPLQSATGHPC